VSIRGTAACPLCGRVSSLQSTEPAVQLDCPDCGPYEVTTGVIGHLRSDARAKAGVRAEIQRQIISGVARPHISLEVLKALLGR